MGCGGSKSMVTWVVDLERDIWTPEKNKKEVPGVTHDVLSNETVRTLTYVPSDYPSPKPLHDNKDTYIRGINFTSVDNRAYQAKDDLQDDYKLLIEYLTNQQQIQNVMSRPGTKAHKLLKVRAIWSWLAKQFLDQERHRTIGITPSIIQNSARPGSSEIGQGKEQHGTIGNRPSIIQNSARPGSSEIHNETVHTPRGDLDLVAKGEADIAVLFALCCRKADLQCAVISGQWKPDKHDVRGPVVEKGLWNAVYLNDDWRLIHPLWSVIRNIISASRDQDQIVIENSKREIKIDDYHFLTDPEEFITRCLPTDKKWQLLKTPVSTETFKQMPHFTEDFFKLKLSLSEDKEGIRVTTNGRARVVIGFPPGKQPQLYYDIAEIPQKDHGSGTTTVLDTDTLKRYVYMFKKEDKYIFIIKFIKRGLYNLKILGEQMDEEPNPIRLLCQLQIKCDDPDETAIPLPYCPAIGWGQSGFAAKLGVVPVSHEGGTAKTKEHRRADFVFKVTPGVKLQAKLDEGKFLPFQYKGNKGTMAVVLPDELTEAMLRIDARSGETEEFINVCNFIVRLQQMSSEKETDRDKAAGHVLALNQALLLEIRGYMEPPSIIYDVMIAALLLLGESRNTLYTWKYVKGVLSRTGKESIRRRMENFDPARADSDRVGEAENLISRYTLEQAWEASAGAAVIYKWIKEVLDEAKLQRTRCLSSSDETQELQNSRFVPAREADDFPRHPCSPEITNEWSSLLSNRKRKSSGNLTDDSDDEVRTSRETSTEILNTQ